jgi:Family of unknown function (DUF5808)
MKPLRRLRRVTKLVGFGLLVAAISQEMAKPEGERTWKGHVFGLVPYDLRPPTWERIRAAYWNPDEPRLFTTRVFGVGWGVNFYRARTLLEQGFRTVMGTAPERVATIRTVRSRQTPSTATTTTTTKEE